MRTQFIEVGANTKVSAEEDTQFVLDLKGFGKDGKVGEHSLEVVFAKPEVEAEIIGVFKLSGGQILKLATSAVHKVPRTSCFTYIKGVLLDNSQSDFVGKIIIEPKAQQTSSYLEDNVLVVGENTRNNSQPILEIEADDVKASHAATTGRIDPEQVYYLQSRGFSQKEAENMIIEGFFVSLLSRIKDEKIKSKVLEKLNA